MKLMTQSKLSVLKLWQTLLSQRPISCTKNKTNNNYLTTDSCQLLSSAPYIFGGTLKICLYFANGTFYRTVWGKVNSK